MESEGGFEDSINKPTPEALEGGGFGLDWIGLDRLDRLDRLGWISKPTPEVLEGGGFGWIG